MKARLFSYNYIDTFIHRLSGLSKLICFLFLTFASMFSFDIRVVLFIMAFSALIMAISRIQFKQIRVMVYYVLVFLLINAILTFFFKPEYGVEIYGTRHVLATFLGRYNITSEQLFYQMTQILKYASVIPLGIIFILTTNPSEFASSISGVGANYKVSFAISLTLRYFPDIQRTYNDISQAQQARGLDMSRKASLGDRFKYSLMIIIPLIFSTLDRIELITNAMDLRGFGKDKKRTWYVAKKMTRSDYLSIAVSALIFAFSLAVSAFINHSRFYNPFI
jgi:energy-coupling factor transport system permease protein